MPSAATLRDGRFAFDRDDARKRAVDACGARRPAQHALEPGRHGADARRAARTSSSSPAERTTSPSSATRSTSRWSTTAGGTSRRPPSRPTPASRTVLVNSLSKTYAMTGWRVGYCRRAAEAIIRAMLAGPPAVEPRAGDVRAGRRRRAPCRSDQECVRRMAAEYQGRRDRVVERLRGIPGVVPLVPEGGPVRDGRRPRAGQAVGRGPAVPAARGGRRRDPRLGLRAGRRGDARASRSRPAARPSSAAWTGSATGSSDWRPDRGKDRA